jgi:hypothetical protein
MRRPKYTTEQLQEAVQTSTSMRQVLAKLSVAPYGGNYDVLRAKLKKLGADTSHFLGRAWNRNRQLAPKTPNRSRSNSTTSTETTKTIGSKTFASYVPIATPPLRLTGARDAPLGLARDCSHRSERWCWFPEFDPIHAGRFRAGCSNYFKSLASTYFATRASSARGIVCYVVGGRGRCWRATLPRGSFRYTLRR